MLTERARAKLNLYLHITGKRADDYHLLDSLFVFTELADELSVVAAPDLSVTLHGPFAHQVNAEKNSVLSAAQLLRQEFSLTHGAHFTLSKQIPAGAGLGGGSADAAAALRLLVRLWKLEISPTELQVLALRLGADVPVCLQSRPMQVSGIGEILQPAPILPDVAVLLIYPHAALATVDVYREFSGNFHAAAPLSQVDSAQALAAALRARQNDLEVSACTLMPQIAIMLNDLRMTDCLLARMSGSGSACFALYSTPLQAEQAAAQMQKQFPDYWIAVTKLA